MRTTGWRYLCESGATVEAEGGINQLWVADITYIRLGCEFVYLALVLDVFSRKVVGWALGRKLASGLAVAALEEAIAEREPPPGLVHHSNSGVQYACREYVALLEKQQMIPSMSRPGNPYDNANCESFMQDIETGRDLRSPDIWIWSNCGAKWASLSSSITTGSGCIRRWATALRKSLRKNRTHNPPGRLRVQPLSFPFPSARATTELLGIGDSNAVPFPRPQSPAVSDQGGPMTASLVSSQGFTYKMTRVTLSNCLISGVHLTVLLTSLSNGTSAFIFNKALWGVGLWLRDTGRGLARGARLSPESPDIARDPKSKIAPRINTDEREQYGRFPRSALLAPQIFPLAAAAAP